ncbi:MAG TPA: MgtC/SapB family protein [Candidatus Pacearchaeota archaeon]|nr:MgtC/SapB family protein [Candidatus Pacearchaeota archaeon]HPO75532.1 MgtC/SapB family protein [Candidatus Pacearchaeota archaeon]
MDIFAIPEIQFFLQLLLSFFLGSLIGVERERIGKEAGLRTFSLVAVGSTLFTILSKEGFLGISSSFDPSRIAAGIVMGIGFLGAGIIVFREGHIEGLTTAAALWSTGAVGMAVGCQFYSFAAIATLIIIIILTLGKGEKKKEIKKEADKK